jgi:hypothetical protein
MAGLAVGSGINFTFQYTFSLRSKVILLIIFYIIFGLTYDLMIELRSGLLSVLVIMASGFLPALFTGRIFRELTLGNYGLTSSPAVYSADLAGSAFGFIFISGFVVPAFGIKISVFLLSALICTGILFGTIRNK